MKPHVAKLPPLDMNDLRKLVGAKPVLPPFPSMHSLEGENRIETTALILLGCSPKATRDQAQRSPKGKYGRDGVMREALVKCIGLILLMFCGMTSMYQSQVRRGRA